MWRDVRRLMLASCMVQRRLANTSKLMKGRHHEYTATLARRQTPRGGSLTHGRGVAFSGWRDRVAQCAAPLGGRPARKGRARRLLDLHLHQLAAYAALCERVGREIQGAWPGSDRCALT